jgi:hypothetical protein
MTSIEIDAIKAKLKDTAGSERYINMLETATNRLNQLERLASFWKSFIEETGNAKWADMLLQYFADCRLFELEGYIEDLDDFDGYKLKKRLDYLESRHEVTMQNLDAELKRKHSYDTEMHRNYSQGIRELLDAMKELQDRIEVLEGAKSD